MHSGGDYQPGREIARGGMGAVLDAHDHKLGRTVAMKVMLRRSDGPEDRRRFLQEARVLGQLAHPNIVPIHDLGKDELGRYFYTMKLVQGITLHDVVARLRKRDAETIANFPLTTLLTIFQKVCDAVGFAHSRGVIHRDLKPQNIMVGEFGEVLVMDWGLAKILPGSPAEPMPSGILPPSRAAWTGEDGKDEDITMPPSGHPTLKLDSSVEPVEHQIRFGSSNFISAEPEDRYATLDGTVMGTPNYMSPEQAQGNISDLDGRSDVFSLGGILYALLTLHPPVEGDSVAKVLQQVRNAEISPPTRITNQGHGLPVGGVLPGSGDGESEDGKLAHIPGGRVPSALSAVVMKALAGERGQRYQLVKDLSADITAYQGGFATKAEHASFFRQLALLIGRHPAVSALSGVLALILVLMAFIGPAIAVKQTKLRQRADNATGKAVASAERVHRQLVGMHVKQGNLLLQSGDPVAALPWYAAALELDRGDQEREWPHRFRLGAVMAEVPRPTWLMPTSSGRAIPALSPDGRMVALGGPGQVVVWNPSTGKEIFRQEGIGDGTLYALQFSGDGKRLICCKSKSLFVWEMGPEGGQLRRQSLPDSSTMFEVDVAGDKAVVAFRDGSVVLHDVGDGKAVRNIGGKHGRIFRLGVDWKARRVLVCADGPTARLYDLDTGDLVAELGHDGPVVWGEFNVARSLVVTASVDGTVQIWESATGTAHGQLIYHPDRLRVVGFDRSGRRIATGCWDSAARIWDVDSGRLVAGPMWHRNSIGFLDFSPEGDRLVTASNDHTARIWDAATGQSLAPPLRHGFLVREVRFFPDGERVLTASDERIVRVWDSNPPETVALRVRHKMAFRTARLSPDGKWLLSASTDGTARVWNATTGVARKWEFEHSDSLTEAGFSRDGSRIFTASEDGRVKIWSTVNGRAITSPLVHQGPVWHAEFGPDGNRLLTAGERVATLWSLPDGGQLRLLSHGNNRIIRWATFDPAGEKILTCSDDRTAVLWDAGSGKSLGSPLAHGDVVENGAFSPDGKLVVTSSRDHTAQIWRVPSGKRLGPALGHAAGVHMSASRRMDGTCSPEPGMEPGDCGMSVTVRRLRPPCRSALAWCVGRSVRTEDWWQPLAACPPGCGTFVRVSFSGSCSGTTAGPPRCDSVRIRTGCSRRQMMPQRASGTFPGRRVNRSIHCCGCRS
jgi:WD40 repeat protein/serine/threonine protein kinase